MVDGDLPFLETYLPGLPFADIPLLEGPVPIPARYPPLRLLAGVTLLDGPVPQDHLQLGGNSYMYSFRLKLLAVRSLIKASFLR